MSRHELPVGFIAIPEVSDHTDHVRIDSLGLPVGFDESQLGVNLRALDGVRRIISANTLRIASADDTSTPLSIKGSINSDGSLASSSYASAEKKAPSTSRLDGKTVTVSLDSTAISDKYPELTKNIRSAELRAQILNKAIKPGLSHGAYKSLELNNSYWAGFTAFLLSIGVAAGVSDGDFTASDAVGTLGFGVFTWAIYARDQKDFALLPFWPVDRYAVARGKIATTKFFNSLETD